MKIKGYEELGAEFDYVETVDGLIYSDFIQEPNQERDKVFCVNEIKKAYGYFYFLQNLNVDMLRDLKNKFNLEIQMTKCKGRFNCSFVFIDDELTSKVEIWNCETMIFPFYDDTEYFFESRFDCLAYNDMLKSCSCKIILNS